MILEGLPQTESRALDAWMQAVDNQLKDHGERILELEYASGAKERPAPAPVVEPTPAPAAGLSPEVLAQLKKALGLG